MKTVALCCLLVLAAAPALADDTAPRIAIGNDVQAIRQDKITLQQDKNKIHSLDRQRDDALRANQPDQAVQLQSEIDKDRAARQQAQQDIHAKVIDVQHEKQIARLDCSKDPACATLRRKEELLNQLHAYQAQLQADEAAAARVNQDKAQITHLQTVLAQIK